MKKEAEHKERGRNQDDEISSSGSDLGEFGLEYEFFITEDSKLKKNVSNDFDPRESVKREQTRDQSKTFFLPNFFFDED
jgi:hypothetical protein